MHSGHCLKCVIFAAVVHYWELHLDEENCLVGTVQLLPVHLPVLLQLM